MLKESRSLVIAPTKALLKQLTCAMQACGHTVQELSSCDYQPLNSSSEIILATPEKALNLLLFKQYAPKLVVIDECHNVYDKDRGWVYELLVQLCRGLESRIVMMSATYDGTFHKYMGVKLYEYSMFHNQLASISIVNAFQPHVTNVSSYLAQYKQLTNQCVEMLPRCTTIVFVPTRQTSVSVALQLAKYFEKYMGRRVSEYFAPQQSLTTCDDKDL